MNETTPPNLETPADDSPLDSRGRARGVWAPALTPLDSNLMPDREKAIRYYWWLLDQGCHGIAFMGTNSEATSFSVAERRALLDATLEAGIEAEQLMVGSGCAALTDAVELAKHATAAGCSLLVLPAFYYKGISDDGLYANYAEIIERVGSPDMKLNFYNFPKLSCVPITHGVMERLCAAYPGVIKGLKDSSGDAAGCAAYIQAFPELAIFPGSELLLLEMLKIGGAGTITAGANVFPGAIRAVYDAYFAKSEELESLNERISAVRRVIQGYDMISALKATVGRALDDPTWRRVRPPLTAVSEETAGQLAKDLKAAGFKFGH
jgi:4-hydroxy-tetrahydrodipicolinate synthase